MTVITVVIFGLHPPVCLVIDPWISMLSAGSRKPEVIFCRVEQAYVAPHFYTERINPSSGIERFDTMCYSTRLIFTMLPPSPVNQKC